jgi:hypothetical protein
MTDPFLDELASAHLDGATTPEEAARVAADPALQARIEELRRIRAAVAAVPPPDPARREAAIRAALAAFADDDTDAGATTAPVPSATSLSARRGPPTRALRVLGAAAAVALLALLVPVLGRLAQSSDDDASSFESTGAAIEDSPDEGLDGADSLAPTTTVLLDRDLGAFDDLDALVTALASPAFEANVESSTAELGEGLDTDTFTACPTTTAGDVRGEARRTATARATVAGDPVTVVLLRPAGERGTLAVYRTADCTLLAQIPL